MLSGLRAVMTQKSVCTDHISSRSRKKEKRGSSFSHNVSEQSDPGSAKLVPSNRPWTSVMVMRPARDCPASRSRGPVKRSELPVTQRHQITAALNKIPAAGRAAALGSALIQRLDGCV